MAAGRSSSLVFHRRYSTGLLVRARAATVSIVKRPYPSAVSCSQAAARMAPSRPAPRRRSCLRTSFWAGSVLTSAIVPPPRDRDRFCRPGGSGRFRWPGGGEREGGDEGGHGDAERPPERGVERADGAVGEQRLQ